MRVLNKKYWPYVAKTSQPDHKADEMYKWCEKTFYGKQRWKMAGPNNWYFTNERDRTMFILRWV